MADASAVIPVEISTIQSRRPPTSVTVETMGSISQIWVSAAARRIARTCVSKDFGKLAVQTCAAHTEKRVLLRSDAQVGRWLVPADIECSDHHGFGEAGACKGVEVELLVLSRGIRPVEKQEFRAKQTDAIRRGPHGTLNVVSGSHVGGYVDVMVTEGHADPTELVGGSNGSLEGLAARAKSSAVTPSGGRQWSPVVPSMATESPSCGVRSTMPEAPTTAATPSDRAMMAT